MYRSWFLKPRLYILENHMLSVCICDNRPTPAYTIAKPWNLSNSIVVHPQLSQKVFNWFPMDGALVGFGYVTR
jgi:hypothetical protein